MNKIILLCILMYAGISLKAQKQPYVYFFKYNGQKVAEKDSADYIRILQESETEQGLYDLREFYPDGKRKTLGTVSAFNPVLDYEGTLVRYNRNGVRIKSENYKKGYLTGMAYAFFDNGKLQSQTEYLEYVPATRLPGAYTMDEIRENSNSKLIYLADSLGNVIVNEGNGHAVFTKKSAPADELLEEGDYKDGYRQGTWTGKYTSGKSTFTEIYEKGKFISGVSIVNGVRYPYKNRFEGPEYPGGMKAWYAYLSSSMKYPKEALKLNLAGTVYTEFTIDKDGRIADIVMRRSIHPYLDDEACRILSTAPKWIPAKERGVPVKVKQNQPFNFKFPGG